MFEYFKIKLSELATAYNERVLHTSQNQISLGLFPSLLPLLRTLSPFLSPFFPILPSLPCYCRSEKLFLLPPLAFKYFIQLSKFSKLLVGAGLTLDNFYENPTLIGSMLFTHACSGVRYLHYFSSPTPI